ncbi:MAG TPA: alpha/beta hydrolase family protein [Pyrinomonadaceae bacterium]|nr:alpha/beta hydrolase family protein [Pyrinomonadaceae bacterium]
MRRIISKIASNSLQREAPYSVLLPSAYDSLDLSYPILYLLHGLFGSHENWVELTNIEELSSNLHLIIVMPDGSDGWYCDSETISANRYESFLIEELIPQIERKFRTIPKREARAIAGLSMGGYGAFKFSVLRPDLYQFAASFSGAFDVPERSDDAPGFDWNTLRPSVLQAFGAPGSNTRTRNDLYRLFQSLKAEDINALPYFYFNCGRDDGFMEANVRLNSLFDAFGISHQFAEIEGGHDWDYWGSRLPDLLKMTTERLVGPR